MTTFANIFAAPAKPWYVLARDVEYAGTTLTYGGLAFVAALWPAGASSRGARRLLVSSWIVGALGTVAALGLEGAWVAQQPATSAWRPSVLSAVLATDFGRQWLVMALLWVLALVILADLLRRGERAAGSLSWRVGAVAVGIATLRVYGMTGHARETADPVIAQLADLAHLSAISLWLGGLAMLLFGVLPRRRTEELSTIMPRYSILAMLSVAAVTTSGAVLAWRVAGSVRAVTSTAYGHTLLLKVGLLGAVLAAAYASKVWVEYRLDFAVVLRGQARLIRPLLVSVAIETALLLLVVTVASALVTADPGR